MQCIAGGYIASVRGSKRNGTFSRSVDNVDCLIGHSDTDRPACTYTYMKSDESSGLLPSPSTWLVIEGSYIVMETMVVLLFF